LDTKFHYWLNESRNTQAQFITWIVVLLVWGSGIPLAFGALGSSPDVAVGLIVVSAATALFHLIMGSSTVDQYKNITADIPEEALETKFAQTERKSPFAFFTAMTLLATIAVFVGHLLILL
jgi:hypothetical protein